MRLMIDTNIFLDVLTQREPFYIYANAGRCKDFFPLPA